MLFLLPGTFFSQPHYTIPSSPGQFFLIFQVSHQLKCHFFQEAFLDHRYSDYVCHPQYVLQSTLCFSNHISLLCLFNFIFPCTPQQEEKRACACIAPSSELSITCNRSKYVQRVKWKGHQTTIKMSSTSANIGNLGKPSSLLNTQFLIYNMGRAEMMSIWYSLLCRTDVQVELVGCSLVLPCSE